jgi:uncharacterized membrane protein YcaP (DUF421 family)
MDGRRIIKRTEMKPEEIHLKDWLRILIGEVPFSFLLELVIRAAVIYLILMVSMRLMGKRMSSQLSRNELATLASLAAAVGVPMMSPDRGLLPGVVIALILICVERFIAARAFKSESFETFAQGQISTLVKDGVIDVAALESVSLSRERLMAQLRSIGVTQMGMIKRFYMEANGAFTIVKSPHPVPGLPTLPGWDDALTPCFEYAQDTLVCAYCARTKTKPYSEDDPCPNCGKKVWAPAVNAVNFFS